MGKFNGWDFRYGRKSQKFGASWDKEKTLKREQERKRKAALREMRYGA